MGWMPIAPWRPISGQGQNLTFGAASVASTVIGNNVQAVQISALTSNCHVAVGMNPTAVVTDMLVKPTDPPLVILIAPGEQIAVIEDTATGTLNVVPVTH
ncbi:hypothetical protein R75461_01138 [Paraburkholderia nemoris]|uniref:hypothetical protein n=1 Tax=Paraburkholderia nemoris TaxID=2793076 RepID=UPI001B0D3377|nr:hypothetical protein [Paraburkholderia nemoris]CAE6712834.1 hypothetical protein R75461_01138 [Paraburkholderia nemoris]